MNITGGCHCEQVKYAAVIDPDQVRICHCTDCQKLSGSAFRVNLPTAAEDFRLLKGQLKSYVKTAASGKSRIQMFCGNCGSQIYATALQAKDSNENTFNLRVGTIDQRSHLPPKQEQWNSSKLPWLNHSFSK